MHIKGMYEKIVYNFLPFFFNLSYLCMVHRILLLDQIFEIDNMMYLPVLRSLNLEIIFLVVGVGLCVYVYVCLLSS